MTRTRLKEGDWIVVADGEKALFLRNLTDHENPHFQVVRVKEQDNPPNRDQATDRPGRMPDAGPGQRSALDEADFHRLAKERFAEDLAEILYKRAVAGAYDRLIVVASPMVLGVLRENWHDEVRKRLVAEIPKTLTNHPIDEIERMVKESLDEA
ncbi:protein required for attachment to host cells [Albidovulum inexpectatum]|uniref:Protein required for attachment to host cells n=1 Tax=Albidovulum inexpectatum TaxID=196587 RepID=A0A2S5JHX6_9RHOB|nr:host attachment family protein [Albidovulum inexpectatum]PPB80971.1 protein required for attachment to host cells [Albidovulum inexpectatum]